MSQSLAPRNADARAVIGRINVNIGPGQPRISDDIEEDGPQHAKLYRCTYYLGAEAIATGEWRNAKGEARLSAAVPALVVLRARGFNTP
jgi:hypothetical protein